MELGRLFESALLDFITADEFIAGISDHDLLLDFFWQIYRKNLVVKDVTRELNF